MCRFSGACADTAILRSMPGSSCSWYSVGDAPFTILTMKIQQTHPVMLCIATKYRVRSAHVYVAIQTDKVIMYREDSHEHLSQIVAQVGLCLQSAWRTSRKRGRNYVLTSLTLLILLFAFCVSHHEVSQCPHMQPFRPSSLVLSNP